MALISVEEYAKFPTAEADDRLVYGAAESQFVDVFLPAKSAAPSPLVILIHGGCWRAQHGLAPMGQMARALAKEGVVVCNVEYRRLGNGGGWPHTFLDVARAADALRGGIKGCETDLSSTVAVGHSAGGHLALWLAARHKLTPDMPLHASDSLPIASVVSLAGIPDLERAVEQSICRGAPQELMGGLPHQVPDRYAAGSPQRLLPLGVTQLHICGSDDWIVPVNYVRRCASQAERAGDEATFMPVARAGHFEIVSARHAVWPTVCDAILERCRTAG